MLQCHPGGLHEPQQMPMVSEKEVELYAALSSLRTGHLEEFLIFRK